MISERSPGDVVLSLAERIQINLAEPRQDHSVVKFSCRRIAGAGIVTFAQYRHFLGNFSPTA